MRKRLLFVSDSPALNTGYGRVVRELGRRLRHEFDIRYAGHYHQLTIGQPCHEVEDPVLPAGHYFNSGDIEAACLEAQPDVVISLGQTACLPAIAEGISKNAAWIAYLPIDSPTVPETWKEALSLPDRIITPSQFGRDTLLRETNLSVAAVHVIPHGVDSDIFRLLPDRAAGKAMQPYCGKFVVGTVARNHERKQLPLLLEAFEQFARLVPASLLHLHTDPDDPMGVDLKAIAARRGLSNKVLFSRGVSFRSGMPDSTLNELLNLFDVFVIPSMGEGFCLPILEAMAAGVPVVATDCSAITELVRNRGELIRVKSWVQSGDVPLRQALADPAHLCELLQQFYTDTRRCEACSKLGRDFARTLSWDRLVPLWSAAIADVLAQGPKPVRKHAGLPSASTFSAWPLTGETSAAAQERSAETGSGERDARLSPAMHAPEERSAPPPPSLSVAFLLAFAPHYFLEALRELGDAVSHCTLVTLGDVPLDQLRYQAQAVLPAASVEIVPAPGGYVEAVNTALRCAHADWLLILEADESIRRADFLPALARLDAESSRSLTAVSAPTLFFWHDGLHTIHAAPWRKAAGKVRLIRLEPDIAMSDAGVIYSSQSSTPNALNDTSWSVFNYSHAITREEMARRVGRSLEADSGKPLEATDWFSAWWELGMNRCPRTVKPYAGPHPAAFAHVQNTALIHDAPIPFQETGRRPLVWEGWIGQEISYGVITDYTVRHLEELGWDPHVCPIDLLGPAGKVPSWTRRALVRESQRRQALLQHPCTMSIRNTHTNGWMQMEYPGAAVKIGYAPHERAALEPPDVARANRMDAILVTSRFVQGVFEASGVIRPMYVYHHGYDSQFLRPVVRRQRNIFTFLAVTVLNLRKGPDILLRAFAQEFARDTDVRLIVKTSPHKWHEDLHRKLLAAYGAHPKITFLEKHHTEQEIADLYNEADCFVLPTRGEGFGMPILEAMATGLPVITTGWSGHMDFCTPENSYLIEVDNLHHLKFAQGCEPWWAAPNEEHLAELMRHVYEHWEEAQARGMRAARDVSSWTWPAKVAGLSEFLEGL